MNSEYWAEFYKTFTLTEPSEFAVWARPRITGSYVVDVGCGNGRDTYYLNETVDTLGVDPHAPSDPWLFRHSRIEDHLRYHSLGPEDTVYARWFLHAVEVEVEDMLLDWCQGQLLVEARVLGDRVEDSHWRRPLDPDDFLDKLHYFGYKVEYFEVSRNFSYTLPLLFRVEAHKEGGALTTPPLSSLSD